MDARTDPCEIRHARVVEIRHEGQRATCLLSEGSPLLVSNFLAGYIAPGDEVEFPIAVDSAGARTEIYIRKTTSSLGTRDLYQAPIGYVTKPRKDKCEVPYVAAEVLEGKLGISGRTSSAGRWAFAT